MYNDFVNAGKAVKTKNGDPICFGYNLPAGCTAAATGQKCPKGFHVCAAGGCQDRPLPHSATTH